jgi:anti-anti-sigma regulatory factor
LLTIAVDHEDARVHVAVMRLEGELDAASYLDVIESARQAVGTGDGYILLDLENLTYMSSAGLFAVHSISMLLLGEEPPNPEYGWASIHEAARDDKAARDRLKLLGPQPQVDRVLERSGLKSHFETYTDRAEALGAF